MDEYNFFIILGRWPAADDLDRVNCDEAGEIGHLCCGWCALHNVPIFECGCIPNKQIQSDA